MLRVRHVAEIHSHLIEIWAHGDGANAGAALSDTRPTWSAQIDTEGVNKCVGVLRSTASALDAAGVAARRQVDIKWTRGAVNFSRDHAGRHWPANTVEA